MSDSILLEGKEYVSARRAAETTGYARDYIGQLARKGLIGAQRVGGLWYVSLESLKGYQANAEAYAPVPPSVQQGTETDSIVSFDGKDYISASRAAKLSGYNQDYVGQLARAGKILSRQVGNRWYVEKEGLLSHKSQKDSLLAAVQREAVGLPTTPLSAHAARSEAYTPFYSYTSEADADLMPALPERPEIERSVITRISPIKHIPDSRTHVIDMRRSKDPAAPIESRSGRKSRVSGKTISRATKAAALLTFVIVVSYGLTSLKDGSRYTFNTEGASQLLNQTASAIQSSEVLEKIGGFIESHITKEIHYIRGN